MNVKGTVYTNTKATIIETFGRECWNSFMAQLARKDEYFKGNIIMSITMIPLDKIIIFFDELIKECFNDDKNVYMLFGMAGAKYALSPGGPYHSVLLTKDLKLFIESAIPKLWATYYDDGTVTGRLENNAAYVQIKGFPIKHFYYEKLLMGYFRQAIKVFGMKSVATVVGSLTTGDNDIHFRYELKDL
jgi:hypothetical protein